MSTTAKNQKLEQLLDKILPILEQPNNPIDQFLISLASKVKTDFFNQFINRHWCASFSIPNSQIKTLYQLLNTNEDEVKEAILQYLDWPEGRRMIGRTEYNIFLLLLIAYLKLKRDTMAKLMMFFILARLYNSVKSIYFPQGCNPEIFRMMFSNQKLPDPENPSVNLAIDNRSILRKYDNPLDLIIKYLISTLYEKYIEQGYKKTEDPYYISQLFKQAWARIKQLFKSYLNTGIAVKYYRIVDLGLHKSALKSKVNDEEGETELGIATVSTEQQEIYYLITNISNYIVASFDIELPQELIDFIYNKTKVRKQFIQELVKHFHNPNLKPYIEDVLLIMFDRLRLNSTNIQKIVCSSSFINLVDKKLISSKHNPDVEEYKNKLSELAKQILQTAGFSKQFEEFSSSHRLSIIRAVNYILVYLVKLYLCKSYQTSHSTE